MNMSVTIGSISAAMLGMQHITELLLNRSNILQLCFVAKTQPALNYWLHRIQNVLLLQCIEQSYAADPSFLTATDCMASERLLCQLHGNMSMQQLCMQQNSSMVTCIMQV